MCGRFVRSRPVADYAALFGAEPVAALPPSWNVAPGQPVLAARARRGGGRELVALRWGLVPSWARDPGKGPRPINARAETAAERPAFRTALRRRRCLVAADGFYEWRATRAGRWPWLFRLADGAPFGLAGLWERWEGPDGTVLETCAVLTVEANATVAPVHARMPLILAEREAVTAWLDPDLQDPAALQELMAPLPADRLVAWPVSRAVNSPRRDEPALVEPVAEPA